MNDSDHELLVQMKNALEITKVAGEKISARNFDLLCADKTLQWMLYSLDLLHTSFATKLVRCLEKRRTEKRNDTFVSLLRYLEDPKSLRNPARSFHGLFDDGFNRMLDKRSMIKMHPNF